MIDTVAAIHLGRWKGDAFWSLPIMAQGCSVESLPASVNVKEEFGEFHQSITQEEGCIRVTISLDIHRGTYAPSSRVRLLEMQKKMQKAYGARVVLVKN